MLQLKEGTKFCLHYSEMTLLTTTSRKPTFSYPQACGWT